MGEEPNLFIMDIASIQPLKGPTGYLYYLDKTYGNTTGEVTSGQRTDQQKPRNYINSGEEADPIRELNMGITRKLIETGNYKLKGDWTLEAEQDFQSQYNVSLEAEVTEELVDEVQREIERKLIRAMIDGVGNTATWNPTGYLAADDTSTDRRSYRMGLYGALIDARAWIMKYKKAMKRGVEFWAIMAPATWARFAKLEQYGIDVSIEPGSIEHRYEGIVNKTFKIYVTNEINETSILVGVSGGWKFAPSYYAPYIPIFLSEKYIRNDDFSQVSRGVMSRSAQGIIPESSTGSTTNSLVLIDITSS